MATDLRQRPVAGLTQRLQPALPSLPTLTLSVDFPRRPTASRGRLRRLRTNRTRRQPLGAHRSGSVRRTTALSPLLSREPFEYAELFDPDRYLTAAAALCNFGNSEPTSLPAREQAFRLREEPSVQHLFVTGGAGFIGSNFVRMMLDKYPDLAITVYDKLTYAGRVENLQDVAANYQERYRFVQGDICDAAAVDKVIAEQQIDAIINFAAETHVDRSILNPDAFIQTDVYGTYVLLEAARKAGNLRYHQISTDEVYGHVEGSHRSLETDCVAPRSPYAASKASADHLVNAYFITYGLPITISRGANNIGPYQYPEKVVPLFVTNALNDMPLPVYGDGKQRRDYQYVLDHCEAVDLVLQKA